MITTSRAIHLKMLKAKFTFLIDCIFLFKVRVGSWSPQTNLQIYPLICCNNRYSIIFNVLEEMFRCTNVVWSKNVSFHSSSTMNKMQMPVQEDQDATMPIPKQGYVKEFTRHSNDVLLNLNELRHRNILTDATLLVGSACLRAHCAVLTACRSVCRSHSDVFSWSYFHPSSSFLCWSCFQQGLIVWRWLCHALISWDHVHSFLSFTNLHTVSVFTLCILFHFL